MGSDKMKKLFPCVIIDNNPELIEYDSEFILAWGLVSSELKFHFLYTLVRTVVDSRYELALLWTCSYETVLEPPGLASESPLGPDEFHPNVWTLLILGQTKNSFPTKSAVQRSLEAHKYWCTFWRSYSSFLGDNIRNRV